MIPYDGCLTKASKFLSESIKQGLIYFLKFNER